MRKKARQLDLYIDTETIIDLMNGSLIINNEKGKGSKAVISLRFPIDVETN